MTQDDKVHFATGAVRDNQAGKENYVETISYLALKRFAIYMTKCGEKYGLGNFKKGIPIESYEESLMRHVQKYFANKYEGANIEPDVDHLSAMIFNIQGILYEEEKLKIKNDELDKSNKESKDNVRMWKNENSTTSSTS